MSMKSKNYIDALIERVQRPWECYEVLGRRIQVCSSSRGTHPHVEELPDATALRRVASGLCQLPPRDADVYASSTGAWA
jgi:hypothetical protein